MSRRTLVALAGLLVVAPLAVQAQHEDHDKKVAGAGALPKGWKGRADGDAKVSETKFAAMGSGWHVTTGPAAIFWAEKDKVKGPYTASVTIRQTKAGDHPEAYGLIFMGDKLDTDAQNYAYFLVRQDGKFLVNHRAGKDVHKIVPWTSHDAVNKMDAKGVATNTLSVDATKADSVRLLVNGKQVHALDKKHLGSTDGVVGVRVNHNLDVHISDLKITPKK
jgi:hypothetical protein